MELIKDLFISILIVACIVLIFSVIFYDKISLGKVIPEAEAYELTNEMQKDLDESYSEETTELITTYSIDAADLKKYEKTKEYDKGKKNPFAEESTNPEGSNTLENDNTTSSNNGGFYEDDGTK